LGPHTTEALVICTLKLFDRKVKQKTRNNKQEVDEVEEIICLYHTSFCPVKSSVTRSGLVGQIRTYVGKRLSGVLQRR